MLKVMVPVQELCKGMYVSELDRPWLDSPFIFQGFRITNVDELSQLKDTCEFVYIDKEKSIVSVSNKFRASTVGNRVKTSQIRLVNSPLPYTSTFEEEAPIAWNSYREIKACISLITNDIKVGYSIQTDEIKEKVVHLSESVIRQPDALSLLCALKEKGNFIASHAINVCVMSLIFGRFLGLEESKLVELGVGALLHDIGELQVSNDILQKKSERTAAENKELYAHTAYGVSILEKSKGIPQSAIEIARDHHERADGSGYPNRKTSDYIGFFTKLVSVVDMYDTVTNGLYGKKSVNSAVALKNIYEWRERLFDPAVVEKFIQCLGIYPIGSVVELRSGAVGIVISADMKSRLSPKLLLVRDEQKNPIMPPKLVNLAMFQSSKQDLGKYKISLVVDPERYDIDVRNYVLNDLNFALRTGTG